MPDYVVEFGKKAAPLEADGRLDAPAFHRNHQAITAVLAKHLDAQAGDAMEIGSGTGQHAVAFARTFPAIAWWPSDRNEKHLLSIAAWRSHAALANLRAPVALDLLEPGWGSDAAPSAMPREFTAIVCINVLHIAPWAATEHLIGGAASRLSGNGKLFIYGPFKRDGRHTAPSNAAFDESLRSGNAEWGIRDLVELESLAGLATLRLADLVEMPANNTMAIFARAGG
jgi:hypothetical protein